MMLLWKGNRADVRLPALPFGLSAAPAGRPRRAGAFAARTGRYNQSASLVQINPRKTFPWIPLAESGLFNALRGIQIKKSLHAELAPPVVLKDVSAAMSLPFSPPTEDTTWISQVGLTIAQLLDF
jgi:hypothetical protein